MPSSMLQMVGSDTKLYVRSLLVTSSKECDMLIAIVNCLWEFKIYNYRILDIVILQSISKSRNKTGKLFLF